MTSLLTCLAASALLAFVVCPRAASEVAPSGIPDSATPNQSLSFGAVSSQFPDAVFTKPSVFFSGGVGYLASSPVYMPLSTPDGSTVLASMPVLVAVTDANTEILNTPVAGLNPLSEPVLVTPALIESSSTPMAQTSTVTITIAETLLTETPLIRMPQDSTAHDPSLSRSSVPVDVQVFQTIGDDSGFMSHMLTDTDSTLNSQLQRDVDSTRLFGSLLASDVHTSDDIVMVTSSQQGSMYGINATSLMESLGMPSGSYNFSGPIASTNSQSYFPYSSSSSDLQYSQVIPLNSSWLSQTAHNTVQDSGDVWSQSLIMSVITEYGSTPILDSGFMSVITEYGSTPILDSGFMSVITEYGSTPILDSGFMSVITEYGSTPILDSGFLKTATFDFDSLSASSLSSSAYGTLVEGYSTTVPYTPLTVSSLEPSPVLLDNSLLVSELTASTDILASLRTEMTSSVLPWESPLQESFSAESFSPGSVPLPSVSVSSPPAYTNSPLASTPAVHSVFVLDTLQPSPSVPITNQPTSDWSPVSPSTIPYWIVSISVPPSAGWLDNATSDTSPEVVNYTEVEATTLRSTTPEWLLNTSDALAHYWVKSVIKVPLSEDVLSVGFRKKMETKLSEVLNEALQRLSSILAGTYRPLRKRRAVTVSNATVQMTNISRADPVEVSHTTLVYYLIEGSPANNITTADRTAGLMQLFSDQELAIKLGYEVVVKAEVYLPPPPADDKRLWIIGAVIGGLAGLVILVWCFLFVYFKCTHPPRKVPSPRPPNPAKISDIDQIDYKGRDVKGFDYARTEVGLENELDRQNVPDYYRRYPMGSTDLEGMYSPGETPPPPFRGHHPSTGSGKHGAKGEPSYPPPAPPMNGFIQPAASSQTQARAPPSGKNKSPGRVDDAVSTDQDTEGTQDTERSEDRRPLSSSKQHRNHKHKRPGSQAGQFEHVSKMGRVEDEDMLTPPTRTTIHAIKAPVLDSLPPDTSLPEIPSDSDIKETLRQKAEIERLRNKQRQREKSGPRRRPKQSAGNAKENRRRHPKHNQDSEHVITNGEPVDKQRKRKKKSTAASHPREDDIEMKPVYDHQVIQPIIPGMQQTSQLNRLESDSSDDGLEPVTDRSGPGSRDKARELVSALLDEAFAMVTPTSVSDPPEEPKHPAPQLTQAAGVHHKPVPVNPRTTESSKLPGVWDPYEASDQASKIMTPLQSQIPRTDRLGQKYPDVGGTRPCPRSPHQYTNPAYMADLPSNIGSQPIQSTDINDSSTPRCGKNVANGFMPESPGSFTPYQRPVWPQTVPTAWDDPDGTLPVANRLHRRQSDLKEAQSKPNATNLNDFHVPKPTRCEDTDDEVDIVSNVMKSGNCAQPLIASIREEIERLAKRSHDEYLKPLPTT